MTITDNVRAIVTVNFYDNRTQVSVLPVGRAYNAWTNTYSGQLTDDDTREIACEYLTVEEESRAVITRVDIPGGYVIAVSV